MKLGTISLAVDLRLLERGKMKSETFFEKWGFLPVSEQPDYAAATTFVTHLLWDWAARTGVRPPLYTIRRRLAVGAVDAALKKPVDDE